MVIIIQNCRSAGICAGPANILFARKDTVLIISPVFSKCKTNFTAHSKKSSLRSPVFTMPDIVAFYAAQAVEKPYLFFNKQVCNPRGQMFYVLSGGNASSRLLEFPSAGHTNQAEGRMYDYD